MAGIVIALDRQEVAGGVELAADQIRRSAAQTVAAEQGLPVVAVATLDDLLAYTGGSATLATQRGRLLAYREAYGSLA